MAGFAGEWASNERRKQWKEYFDSDFAIERRAKRKAESSLSPKTAANASGSTPPGVVNIPETPMASHSLSGNDIARSGEGSKDLSIYSTTASSSRLGSTRKACSRSSMLQPSLRDRLLQDGYKEESLSATEVKADYLRANRKRGRPDNDGPATNSCDSAESYSSAFLGKRRRREKAPSPPDVTDTTISGHAEYAHIGNSAMSRPTSPPATNEAGPPVYDVEMMRRFWCNSHQATENPEQDEEKEEVDNEAAKAEGVVDVDQDMGEEPAEEGEGVRL